MQITTANKPMFHNVNFEKADTGDDFLQKSEIGVNFQHCHISRDVEREVFLDPISIIITSCTKHPRHQINGHGI